MLTAKIGNNIINCFDNKYSKEELKMWAKKNIIYCPICGKAYEYCHGLINTPYFRHKDKSECEYLYSEPETEEHVKGKIALYNWIRKQKGVNNVVLEGWLSETKQRPDIMFEYCNQKWVIEFQCNPIATEQIERHKLYEAGNIKDIWICGKEKYGTGKKHMEKIMVGMFDYEQNMFFEINDLLNIELLPYKNIKQSNFKSIKLEEVTFNNKIVFTNNAMTAYIEKDLELEKERQIKREKRLHIEEIYNVCSIIPKIYEGIWHNCVVTMRYGSYNSPYLIMMNFSSDVTEPFTLFIKDNLVDICEVEKYNRKIKYDSLYHKNRYIWHMSTRFINIGSLKYEDKEDLVSVIREYFSSKLREGIIRNYNVRGDKHNG